MLSVGNSNCHHCYNINQCAIFSGDSYFSCKDNNTRRRTCEINQTGETLLVADVFSEQTACEGWRGGGVLPDFLYYYFSLFSRARAG